MESEIEKNVCYLNGKEYLYTVPGLGATMFTINFDAKKDGNITVDSIDKALKSTASDQTGETQYYYKVTTADQLDDALCHIVTGSRLCAEDEGLGLNIEIGIFLEIQIKTDDIQSVEKLSLVLVKSLDVNVVE